MAAVQGARSNSVSGPKQYPSNENGWDMVEGYDVTLARRGENSPFYQLIEIDGDTLHYEARAVLDQLYDDFEMKK